MFFNPTKFLFLYLTSVIISYICKKDSTLEKTLSEYDTEVKQCRDLFLKKTKDYGTAWRILRPTSLTDQLYIKAERIRSIEEKGVNRVGDSIESEYIGLVNYSVLALIQLELPRNAGMEIPYETIKTMYDDKIKLIRDLMIKKNHDYGEAWRGMRLSSMTDLILQKLLRIKQIEDNQGQTLVSEGLDANYMDIVNYALFALIKISSK